MSADPGAAQGGQGGWSAGAQTGAADGPSASEEEMRAAYEAELSRITTTDMIAQTVISLLNLGARRLGLAPATAPGQDAQGGGAQAGPGAGDTTEGRDLDQVRDAIDGVRALMDILERRMSGELGPLRDALSQLQMAYAREVQAPAGVGQAGAGGVEPGGSDPTAGGSSGGATTPGAEQSPASGRRPGPAEQSGRLWVPGR